MAATQVQELLNSASPAALDAPRQAPHNIEAERALLGAVLIDNKALDRVSGFLSPDHFYDPLHGSIFETLATLIHAGKTATPVTVKTFFENVEPIDAHMTVPQYLGRLAAEATTTINAAEYGRTIYDLATRRSLIIIGEDMVNTAYDSAVDHPPQVLIEEQESRLARLKQEARGADSTQLIEFPDDFEDAKPEPEIWEGTICQGGVGIAYGPSCAGKTFFGIALAFAVVRGKPFMGLKTTRGPVLIIPHEGRGGIKRRLLAARKIFGPAGRHLAVMNEPAVMGRMPGSERCEAQIINAAKELERAAGEPVAMIIIDTWHQAIAGDNDNDSGTAGAVFKQSSTITKATGATVLFIDHPGHNGELRGSSAKKPSCDFLLRFDKDDQTAITEIDAEKVKDGREGPRGAFRLKQVELAHGKTSCVAEPTTEQVQRRPKRPKPETAAAKALTELEHLVIAGKCEMLPHHDRILPHAKTVKIEHWREACDRKGLTTSDERKTKNRAFERALNTLSSKNLVGCYEGRVWLLGDTASDAKQ